MAAGLDVVTGQARELADDGIVDLYQTKWWALRLAADAAVTVLKVDQIIMVRPYICLQYRSPTVPLTIDLAISRSPERCVPAAGSCLPIMCSCILQHAR